METSVQVLSANWQAVVAVAGVAFAAFLLGAGVALFSIFGAAKLTIAGSARSLTPDELTLIAGFNASATLARSQRESDALRGRDTASSGSSNSSAEERRTFISSSPTDASPAARSVSSEHGSLDRGMESSEAANDPTYSLEPSSTDFAQVAAALASTRENMQPSMSKRPCRMCLKLRGFLDGFGGSKGPKR